MKKIFLVIGMLVMLLTVPLVSANPSLKASLLRYEPLPAAPGQFVTVYVKLENVGNDDAKNVALRMQDQFPFSITREDERVDDVGVLKSQQSVVSEFRVRVDSQAFIGNNLISFEFTPDTAIGQWQEANLNIDVESDEASLTITKVDASDIVPGGEGTLSITIKNNEETVLRNVALQLELIATIGSTSIDLPFIPVDSATEKRISRLNPGEIATVSFKVKAYPTSTPGYYKLPLSLSYVNDQGVETTTSDYAGVVIKAVPEMKILLDSTTITKENMKGTVTFKFINKGINDLKFLDSTILEGDGYEVTSNSQDYIGDLDSDDYRSETYSVTLSKENVAFDIQVSFKDENNQEYTQTISVPVRYSEPVQQKNNTAIVIVIIIIIAGAIWYFRRKKKAQKNT